MDAIAGLQNEAPRAVRKSSVRGTLSRVTGGSRRGKARSPLRDAEGIEMRAVGGASMGAGDAGDAPLRHPPGSQPDSRRRLRDSIKRISTLFQRVGVQ